MSGKEALDPRLPSMGGECEAARDNEQERTAAASSAVDGATRERLRGRRRRGQTGRRGRALDLDLEGERIREGKRRGGKGIGLTKIGKASLLECFFPKLLNFHLERDR